MNVLSLLFLLLITHWSNAASLRSDKKFLDHQNVSEDSIHSQLPLVKRLRRWIKSNDNDEVEIPVNETRVLVTSSDDTAVLNSTANDNLLHFETIESNSSIIETFDELINPTISFLFNTTINDPLLPRQHSKELNQTDTNEIIVSSPIFNEYTTIEYPLTPRQDSKEMNQTDMNETIVSSPIFNESTTIKDPLLLREDSKELNQTDTNETIVLSTIFNESTTDRISSSVSIILNQTELATTNVPSEDNVWDSFTITASNLNLSQNNAIIIDNEILENSNISAKAITIPLCDRSCQCAKECPYGFEVLNDTCLCNPLCENYQCFGNDTCIVTDNDEPLCLPENGTKHDRPSRCYQPRVAGYHDDNVRYHNRWYYNPDQDTCHLFVYRGLGGNENNFRTLNECHLECITCAPLPDPGECLGHIDMWYYDNKNSECIQFEYSGCKGNENKFLKKEQCIDTCINRIVNN